MIKMCPYCNDEKEVQFIVQPEIIVVRHADVHVIDRFLKCTACNNDFDDPLADYDVLAEAYRRYNQMFPEDPIGVK